MPNRGVNAVVATLQRATRRAWELLAAAVDPFVVRLGQLVDLGLRDAATEVGAGVVLGLSQASGDDECAIYFGCGSRGVTLKPLGG